MLKDKDIAGVCSALGGRVSAWFAATLAGPRGASSAELARAIAASGAGGDVLEFSSPLEAFAAARNRAGENDRIVVFGSFHTVAEIMAGQSGTRGT
jgi:dihydrofolate synthase / folylpolyglutamate synthase